MNSSVHHQIQLLVAVVCLLSSTALGHPLQQSHKVDKRQSSLVSCFSEVEVAGDETRCTGERLGGADSIEECCRPRSTGGLEGGGFSLGGLTDCMPCPENVTSDIQVTCFSGVGCDISEAPLVVPDIPSCCLLSGERSYTLSDSQACQTCVVVQWADSPGLDLPEQSISHVLTVEYSKGADIGLTNGQLRVIPRYITADANDILLTDPNLNLNGRDFSAIISVRPDNTALEVGDTLQLILQPSGRLAPNEILLDTLDVTIIDRDAAEILLTELDYRLSPEDDGLLTVVVEVRTQISSSAFLRLIPLSFSSVRDEILAGNLFLDDNIVSEVFQPEDVDRPSEAISVADFDDSPIVFEVDSIGDYRVGIPITADDIYEAEQSFVVLLELVNTSLSDLVAITPSRQAAVCRIIDDDSINLSWELPAYTFFEGRNDESSLSGFFDSPIIVKVNASLTEYLLEIYAQPRSTTEDLPFRAEWRDPNRDIDNDFVIGTSSPGLVRRIDSMAALDEIAIDIFADNVFNEGHEVAVLEFTNSENRPEFLFGANPITQIVIIDRNLTVGFTRETTRVSEGVGSFELCVAIFIPELNLLRGPFQLANPFTLRLMSANGTAGPLDYVQITADDNLLVPFETDNSTHLQCFNVTIMEDTEFERNEDFSLTLSLEGSPLQTVVVEPFVSVVEIVDNDAVTIGFELTEHTVSENDVEVTLMVSILEGQTSLPVTIALSTVDGTATSGSDYNATMVTFTLSDLTDSVNITIAILPDSIVEGDEQFSAVLSLIGPLQFTDKINIEPGTALVNILDSSSETETVIRVNDTVIGDPLFTVPLRVTNLGELGLGDSISLCYEVHGDADKYFNLVSDICTSVNAHYMNVSVFNVIDRIAIRAVDEGGACREVLLNVEGMCSVSVDGTSVESSYMRDGISIRRYPGNRVRVSVPNCAHLSLVMWVFCQNSTLMAYDADDNPVTASAVMMKFVIARGFNLQERSHGLIGQFWNIPITLQLVNDSSEGGLTPDPYYTVMVAHPDSAPRTFTAFYYPRTWEVIRGQNDPCIYAGGQQADSTDTSNSVIQGTYRDYVVSEPFSTQYLYSKFQDDRC